jgi:cardiolipin synthase (CMP-forming)
MPITLANKITITRILLIPLFILLVLYFDKSTARGESDPAMRCIATSVFGVIFILDGVDGYIARKRNEVSRLGTLIDPVADKLLLLSALILLSLPSTAFGPLPTWFIVIVISRDVMLMSGTIIIQHMVGHVTVRPRISGKLTTFFQAIVCLWVLTGLPYNLINPLCGLAAALTLISATQYVFDGIRQLEKAR